MIQTFLHKKRLYPVDKEKKNIINEFGAKYTHNTFEIIANILFLIDTSDDDFLNWFQTFVLQEINSTEKELSTINSKSLLPSTQEKNQLGLVIDWYYKLLKSILEIIKEFNSNMKKCFHYFYCLFSKYKETDWAFINNKTVIDRLKRELLLCILNYNNLLSNQFIYQCFNTQSKSVIDYDNIIF